MGHRFLRRLFALTAALTLVLLSLGTALADDGILEDEAALEAEKARMAALYGENKPITNDDYDKSLAVKCVNGTFVGRKTDDNIIAFKGIPYVGSQPTGENRWKRPVDFVPDDGVYEAYYIGKAPCQSGDISQKGSLYPQGEDCLYLNIWTAENTGDEKKAVMVWIHGGAFEMGGTAEPRDEGTNFVKENPDVILVSVECHRAVHDLQPPGGYLRPRQTV